MLKMKKIILILLFAISYQLSAVGCQVLVVDSLSQNQSAHSSQLAAHSTKCESLLSKKYLKSYWNSGLTVLAQPLHYDWKDWTVFGGVAAVTTLALVYDDEIYDFVDGTFGNEKWNTASKCTDVFGEEYFILPTVALTYAVGAIGDHCRLKNMSLAALQSFVYAEVASAGLKVLTCRLRPSEVNSQQSTVPELVEGTFRHFDKLSDRNSNSQTWLGAFKSFKSTSFPSGHAMRSFALATTVAGFYPDKKWVGIVSYSLATMTSLGRVVSKEHWASDVIVGAALGYFIGRGVVKFNEKIGNISSVEIQPIATNYGLGVVINF